MNHMTRQRITQGLACGLLLIGSAPLFGQEESRERTTRTTRTTSSSTQVMKFTKILDSKVLIQQDRPAGQIVDVVFGDGGCIDYVVASYEKEYYAIPFSAARVRYADRVVFVDISQRQFDQIEFFAANNWPDLMSTTYQKQVFTTFGVDAVRNEGSRTTLKANTSAADRDRDDQPRDRRDAKDRDDQPRDRRDAKDRDDQPARKPADRDQKDEPKSSDAETRPRSPKDAKPDSEPSKPGTIAPPPKASSEKQPPKRDSDRTPPKADPQRNPPKPDPALPRKDKDQDKDDDKEKDRGKAPTPKPLPPTPPKP